MCVNPPPSPAAWVSPLQAASAAAASAPGAGAAATAAPSAASLKDVKDIVEKVLVDSGYRDTRAGKMGIDNFLELLTAMNAAGIHFAA